MPEHEHDVPDDDEPRANHYGFAHRYLRALIRSDPLRFLIAMSGEDNRAFLTNFWGFVASRTETGAVVEAAADDFEVQACRIVDRPAVLLRLPPAARVAEAHMIGVVIDIDPEGEEPPSPEDVPFRYYTLERSASGGTVLGAWEGEVEHGIHLNFGEGPPAEFAAFGQAVAGRMKGEET